MTRINILKSLCYTDVVTSINDEALILVRNTYGNSKSKVLNSISKFDIFGKRLSKARAYRSGSINLHLLGNAESRLDTCLESKTLNRIEPKNTSVVITCYGRDGKEVKRVTCTDGENGGMA